MSDHWLGKPAPFHEAFPSVEFLRLEGKQHGELRFENNANIHLSDSNLPAVINCANPRCQQGGYRMQSYLFLMIEAGETEFEHVWHCDGHEGSPKGRRKGDPCMNYIEFKISVGYKDP